MTISTCPIKAILVYSDFLIEKWWKNPTVKFSTPEIALYTFKIISWVNNLELYFHTEVIELEWFHLKEGFESKNVKKFMMCHERYLHNISKKCFLVNPALCNVFIAVIKVCEKFSMVQNEENYGEFDKLSWGIIICHTVWLILFRRSLF